MPDLQKVRSSAELSQSRAGRKDLAKAPILSTLHKEKDGRTLLVCMSITVRLVKNHGQKSIHIYFLFTSKNSGFDLVKNVRPCKASQELTCSDFGR